MAYALFALNALVSSRPPSPRTSRTIPTTARRIPSLAADTDRKMNDIRTKLYEVGTQSTARSSRQEARSSRSERMTNQRVQLYRRANIPPPPAAAAAVRSGRRRSSRRFPCGPEVSLNNHHEGKCAWSNGRGWRGSLGLLALPALALAAGCTRSCAGCTAAGHRDRHLRRISPPASAETIARRSSERSTSRSFRGLEPGDKFPPSLPSTTRH